MHGSTAQGLGEALFEQVVYDRQSGQLLSGSFMDYAMPRAADMPSIVCDVHPVPTKTNPLGVKGGSEAGNGGAPPAIINAIIDALAPLGVTDVACRRRPSGSGAPSDRHSKRSVDPDARFHRRIPAMPAARPSRTAVSTRRHSIAITSRSGRCWRNSSPARAAMRSNSAAAPAGAFVAFARETPAIAWWPGELNERHLQSIAAWRAHAQLGNVRAPRRIDLSDPEWWVTLAPDGAPEHYLAIVCINVLHISPWRVTEGVLTGAARGLAPDGRLFVYGPFMRDGGHTAPSNAAFDASLRSSDPSWGVRDTRDLAAFADRVGLRLAGMVEMPANNFVLEFAPVRRRGCRLGNAGYGGPTGVKLGTGF